VAGVGSGVAAAVGGQPALLACLSDPGGDGVAAQVLVAARLAQFLGQRLDRVARVLSEDAQVRLGEVAVEVLASGAAAASWRSPLEPGDESCRAPPGGFLLLGADGFEQERVLLVRDEAARLPFEQLRILPQAAPDLFADRSQRDPAQQAGRDVDRFCFNGDGADLPR